MGRLRQIDAGIHRETAQAAKKGEEPRRPPDPLEVDDQQLVDDLLAGPANRGCPGR